MTKQQIKEKLERFFKIHELVCPHVYERFGEKAWDYFDIRLLETLLFIRTELNMPMTVNNWKGGGMISQRGLRCNLCSEVKSKTYAYLSSHIFGKGIDFVVKGMTANAVRDWITKHQDKLPYPIRLEVGPKVTWVHLDVCNETDKKIVYFNG